MRLQGTRHPAPEAGPELTLAGAARRALAADGVVVLDLASASDPQVLAAEGVSPDELELVVEATAPGRGSIPGFAAAAREEYALPGLGSAAVCALQRNARSFENASLLAAFARHAAVASAV